jgi:hypothetical protein
MTDVPTQPTEGPPPEAAQLPAEPSFGDRFDQIKAEIRAEVDQKLADAAEVARQAINDLSDKLDALQTRWDEREAQQGTS